jgi:HPt (histidine-containing phosphotransfer) domain-containing protein
VAPAPLDAFEPAESQGAAVQTAFARLQSQFLTGLPQRWAEIVSAPQGPLRAAALHRLTGAAGGYGLVALSDAARQAETALGADSSLLAVRREIEAAGVTVPSHSSPSPGVQFRYRTGSAPT